MQKAAIIYHSRTGTTRQYAFEIGKYLQSRDIDTEITSIPEYREEIVAGADYVFLGCWTSGLMVLLQHPEKAWKEFAGTLPSMPDTKLVLFTTYLLMTGSMFRNMYKQVKEKISPPELTLKSRNGSLSGEDRQALDDFIK